MSAVADLELRLCHRTLASSGATPTQYTASGGSAQSISAAALTEGDDAWNGALVRIDSGANEGRWALVSDFVAATDTLTLDDVLPDPIAAGDTFTLFLGGKFASSVRATSLRASKLVNVTGFELEHVAALNGEGTGTLRFYDDETVTWQPPGEAEGEPVDVSGLSAGQRVIATGAGSSRQQASKFVRLERTVDSLPVSDAVDDVSLDLVAQSFLPRVTVDPSTGAATLYRPIAIMTTAAAFNLRAYCESPFPEASATTLSTSIGTGAASLRAASLDGWGYEGWVFNATKNDVRFFVARSGNDASILSPGSGLRGFTAIAWDAGDVLEPMPWFDIGSAAPGIGNVLEDPATPSTAPSGIGFSCPRTLATATALGDLAPGGVCALWLCFIFPAGIRPLEGGRVDLRVSCEVTE